jgi:hypothetical protein
MKPEKKISAAKKTNSKKIQEPKPAAKIAKPEKPAAAPPPATRKAAEVVKAAAKTAKKVTTTVKEAAGKAVETAKKAAKKKIIAIPSILLEGDRPEPPAVSGPGQRYSLGPTPPKEHFVETGELPEAYGTKRLTITARDPHWLYAHWDLTRDQLREYNALSTDGHLVVRVCRNQVGGQTVTEVHVHPESRNWFIHVGEGATKYAAELGYYNKQRKWVQIATAAPTLTPPDRLSEDTSVRFATIPIDVPFEQLLKLIKTVVSENIPLAEAIQQLRAAGFEKLPEPEKWSETRWTPEQERTLAAVVTMDQVRRVWIGSLEVTELVRRQLAEEMASISAAQLQLPSSISIGSLASPFGGAMEQRKGFWFNVNAELIIYGATEPDAKVTIGGRQIKLRPDGTFSYRFILPDGAFQLPAEAVSADGDDRRLADLKFSRRTDYRGDVGAHPQDPQMKPPLVENVA